MRILFLTPQPPFPANQGTTLRTSWMIRIAAEAGHEVDLLTFGEEREPTAAVRRVISVPAPATRSPLKRARQMALSDLPDLLWRLWSPAFRAALERLLEGERYEVLQVEGLEMARYLPVGRRVLTVLDEHNAELLLQQRAYLADRRSLGRVHGALYSFIQWRRLRRWEARACTLADSVLAASEHDAAVLRSLSGREVAAIPNGIDLARTPFVLPGDHAPPELLFDGTMSFRPNHDAATWLADEIMPRVRTRHPDARVWVVGRDPPPGLTRANFAPDGVVVTGTVPSTERYWHRASIYVLPMRIGGGVRFKALEAMARGLPLVATVLGMEGTGAAPGRDYLQAEQPEEFAAAISRLLADPSLRRRLAATARETVAARDWSRIAPRLEAVYAQLGRRAA